MLHTETIDKLTLDLLIKLMNFKPLTNFYLGGGTGLSLQLGHRISLDLDLFTKQEFDPRSMAEELKRIHLQ